MLYEKDQKEQEKTDKILCSKPYYFLEKETDDRTYEILLEYAKDRYREYCEMKNLLENRLKRTVERIERTDRRLDVIDQYLPAEWEQKAIIHISDKDEDMQSGLVLEVSRNSTLLEKTRQQIFLLEDKLGLARTLL